MKKKKLNKEKLNTVIRVGQGLFALLTTSGDLREDHLGELFGTVWIRVRVCVRVRMRVRLVIAVRVAVRFVVCVRMRLRVVRVCVRVRVVLFSVVVVVMVMVVDDVGVIFSFHLVSSHSYSQGQ